MSKIQVSAWDYTGAFHTKSEHDRRGESGHLHTAEVSSIDEAREVARRCGDHKPTVVYPSGTRRTLNIDDF